MFPWESCHFPAQFEAALMALQCRVEMEGWPLESLVEPSLYWCALLMETTARAGRASLVDSYPGKNAWTGLARESSAPSYPGQGSDRGAGGDKSLSYPTGEEWLHLQEDELLVTKRRAFPS